MALVPLLLVLLLALATRLWLLAGSHWLLDGDDALSALMALAILDGDRPIMLKNQAYAAAWEPYAMAASYALFGVSRVTARLPALVASLAFVGVTWLLAREVAGKAAAWFAAALVTVPPVYILVLSLKPLAPYTETAVFGTLALWCAVRIAARRARQEAVWAAACGLAGGLAFWMHPLAVYYLVPTALVLLLSTRGKRLVRVVPLGLAGFLVGGLPVWLYNLQTSGATLRYLQAGTSGQRADRLDVLVAWWNVDLPRATGLSQPWGDSPLVLAIAMTALLLLALLWALFWRAWLPPKPRLLDSVLLLLATIPAVFSLSGFGSPIINPWNFDATGRYSLPIWGGLAVVLGAFLGAVWRWNRYVGLALVEVALLVNVYACAAADPVRAFQSPYWNKLPPDNTPLLAILRAEGISHVWMNHWAAFPAMLDARAAGQPLIAYDWYDVEAGGIDRFPEYLPLVEQAEQAAFVLITDEPEPELEGRLRELSVTFRSHRAPPYVVVLPLSRKVHPSEVTDAIDYRY